MKPAKPPQPEKPPTHAGISGCHWVKCSIHRFKLSPRGDFLVPLGFRRRWPVFVTTSFHATVPVPGEVWLERCDPSRTKFDGVPPGYPRFWHDLRIQRGRLRLPPDLINAAGLSGTLVFKYPGFCTIYTVVRWREIQKSTSHLKPSPDWHPKVRWNFVA